MDQNKHEIPLMWAQHWSVQAIDNGIILFLILFEAKMYDMFTIFQAVPWQLKVGQTNCCWYTVFLLLYALDIFIVFDTLLLHTTAKGYAKNQSIKICSESLQVTINKRWYSMIVVHNTYFQFLIQWQFTLFTIVRNPELKLS